MSAPRKVCPICAGHGFLRGGPLMRKLNSEMVPTRPCADCKTIGMVPLDFLPKGLVRIEDIPEPPKPKRASGHIWRSMGGRKSA